jgi:tetratricopeptide (TPR) repeat protein
MVKLNRKIVVLILVLVIGLGVPALGIWYLMSANRGDPSALLDRAREAMVAGDTEAQAGRYDEAKRHYDEALLLAEEAVAVSARKRADALRLAVSLEERRPEINHDKIIEYLKDAIEVARPDEDVLTMKKDLAEKYLSLGRLDDARAVTVDLANSAPDNDEYQRLLSNVHLFLASRRGDTSVQAKAREDARAAAQRAVELGPKALANYEQKIQVIRLVGNLEDAKPATVLAEAEKVARDAVANVRDEDTAGAWILLSNVQFWQAGRAAKPEDRQKLLAASEESAKKALAADSSHLSALLRMASLAGLRNDAKAQEDYLRQAVAANPTRDLAYFELMRLLFTTGRSEEASQLAVTAAEKCPPVRQILRSPSDLDSRARVLALAAQILITRKEYDQASSYADRLRAISPKGVEPLILDAMIATGHNKPAEAYVLYERALKLCQEYLATPIGRNDDQRRQILNQELQIRIFMSQLQKSQSRPGPALEHLREADRLSAELGDPGRQKDVLEGLTELEFACANYDQAEKNARRLLAVSSPAGQAPLLRILTMSLLMQGRYESAAVEARKFLDASPQSPEAYTILGEIQGRLRQPAEQERTYRQGLTRVAKDQRILLYQSLLALHRSRNESAKEASLLAEIQADDGVSAEDKGRLSMLGKSADELIKYYQAQVDASPDNPQLKAQLAAILLEINRTDEAVAMFKRAFDLAIAQPQKYPGLAKRIWEQVRNILLTTRKVAEARAWIQDLPNDSEWRVYRRINEGRLQVIDGRMPPAEEIQGLPGHKILAVQRKHVEEAIRIFESLAAEAPAGLPNIEVVWELARAYGDLAVVDPSRRTFALQKAGQNFQTVVKAAPQNLMAHLELTNVYLQQGAVAEALTQLNQAQEKWPNSEQVLLMKADVLARKPDRPEAIKTRLMVREKQPKNVDNLLALALLYEATGQTDKAMAVFREAHEAAPDQPVLTLQYAKRLFSKDPAAADQMITKLAEKLLSDIDAATLPPGVKADDRKAQVYLLQAEYYRDTAGASEARVTQARDLGKKAVALSSTGNQAIQFYGRLLLDLRDLTGAIQACRDYLARHPEDLLVEVLYCEVLAMGEETIDEADRRLAALPPELLESPQVKTIQARTWYKMAMRARINKRPDEAKSLLSRAEAKAREAVKDLPVFGDGNFALGQILAEQGRSGEASEVLGRILPGDPRYVEGNITRATLESLLGNQAKAVQSLRNVLDVDPRHLPARLGLIQFSARARDFAGAARLVNEGLAYYPDNYNLMQSMIDVLLQQARVSPSTEVRSSLQTWSDRLVRSHPKVPAAWLYWARAMAAMGRGEEALTRISELRKAAPDDLILVRAAVEVYGSLRRFGDSASLLEETLRRLPREADGRYVAKASNDAVSFTLMLADALVLDGQVKGGDLSAAMERAQKAIRDGMAATQRHPELLSKLIRVFLMDNKPDQALPVSEELVQKYPSSSEAWIAHGQVLLSVKRHDDAFRAFGRAYELDPNNSVAANNLAWDLADRQVNPAEAQNYANRALLLDPENADFLDTAGWIQYALKNYPQAIAFLDKAWRLMSQANHPGLACTQYHLAAAHAMQARSLTGTAKSAAMQKANDLFKEAQTKWPTNTYTGSTLKAFEMAKSVLKD